MSSQLKYLMQLLDDETPGIRKIVLDELTAFGANLEEELSLLSIRPNKNQRDILTPIFEKNNRDCLRSDWPKLFDISNEYERLEKGWQLLSTFQNGCSYPFTLKYLLDQITTLYLENENEVNEVSLAKFLFGKDGLKGNNQDYLSPKNSDLVHVIRHKSGVPIGLTSIYILVGYRLGLAIESYNFPGHFLAKISHEDHSVLVDCFNSGLLIDEKYLLFASNIFSANLSKEDLNSNTNIILSRSLRDLIRSYQSQKDDKNSSLILEVLKESELIRKEHEKEAEAVIVTSEPSYYIGQVVKHAIYGYRGVVVDYDLSCKATEEWYHANQTQPPSNQPWYHILVHTSTHNTYVAQNNLIADISKEKILHPFIYVFFSEFKDGAYLRNDNNWPTQY